MILFAYGMSETHSFLMHNDKKCRARSNFGRARGMFGRARKSLEPRALRARGVKGLMSSPDYCLNK